MNEGFQNFSSGCDRVTVSPGVRLPQGLLSVLAVKPVFLYSPCEALQPRSLWLPFRHSPGPGLRTSEASV